MAMNPSISLTTAPCSPGLRNHFIPTFASPRPLSAGRRRRRRISTAARASSSSASSVVTSAPAVKPDAFGERRELTGVQSLVEAMPSPVRIAGSVVVVAAAAAAGYGLGSRLVRSPNAALGGAVLVGAAGMGAAYALNSCVPEVAAAGLRNYVVGCDDPWAIKKEEIDAIANKYGISKQNDEFNAELCDIYSRFVSSVLPPGNEDLRGDEVDTIIKFKKTLGIDDPDAAAMHMEIGRRLFRQRLETGDREADMEQRRAFQKLVYVSNLVFGEASGFLLPWKRVFKITDAQVEIAVRENAKRLYAVKLGPISQDIDVNELIRLREAQLHYQLSDELAEDMFREHTRRIVEQNLSVAISGLKSRNSEVKRAIEELDKILAFNNMLISLKSHPDASRFACGVGPVSLIGGEYDGDKMIHDLKFLYRTYLTDALSGGRLEENKLAALNQLRNIFGLGKREAETISLEVTTQAYRRCLQQAVSSGDLKNADSKAAYLQNLCEELHFDPEKAIEMHEEIYRRKLGKLVAAQGELSDDDVETLEQIQIMFCIRKETVEKAHSDICGRLFDKLVRGAVSAGESGYDAETRKAIRKAAFGLRLTRDMAMTIASKAVRMMFMNFVESAKEAKDRDAAARELKKMIVFNRLVVTPLIADIKGKDSLDNTPPPEDLKPEHTLDIDEEWKSLESISKVLQNRNAQTFGLPIQKEINLRDDLPERERANVYKSYLQYCLIGAVTKTNVGQRITEVDDTEYISLNQLGDILGLTDNEIVKAHISLAEQSFRQQAEFLLADGQLTKKRMEQLDELQKDSGLPLQYAQKVIKGITSTKLSMALETAVSHGKLSVKEIRDLKENGIDADTVMTESLRESIFKKTMDKIFSSGTGEFDEEEVYEKIPKDLNIDADKAKGTVKELARTKMPNLLVQAVALLRQKNHAGVVNSVNNMLACDKAVPSTPLSWQAQGELNHLFAVYLKSDATSEKVDRVKYLLNISDSVVEAARNMVIDEKVPKKDEEEFVF
ncbi:chloroplast inner envelope family protein [Striga asiatica]|uniref:Chloroplast inner envelope family protein n=1 Tax=Striga asiatica TaxID=4170 RepID=A0A5A7PRR2_STRAF|nr:chloroplast inner envelope family protein [Striga asiatica]